MSKTKEAGQASKDDKKSALSKVTKARPKPVVVKKKKTAAPPQKAIIEESAAFDQKNIGDYLQAVITANEG